MSSKTKRLGTLADIYQAQKLDGAITPLRLSRLRASKDQPRQDRKASVEELAQSLKTDGLLSPIIVKKEGDFYRIIAGERRYHAAASLGWEQMECRIISRKEADYWRIAIIENLQRENLKPHEEAAALQRLKQQERLSDAQLAELVAKSRNYITEILGIALLPPDILERCQNLGMQQRNMLIQAVQAYKTGNIEAFLSLYRKGTIQTVRAARQFNQSKKVSKAKKAIKAAPHATPLKSQLQIEVLGNIITIQCASKEQAQALAKQLQHTF